MTTVVLAPREPDSIFRGLFAEDLGADSCILGQHRVKVHVGQNDYEMYFRPEELLPVEGKESK